MGLHLEPEAIDQCVRICDQMLGQLDSAIKAADQLGNVDGFGGFRIGQQLKVGYQAKGQEVVVRMGQYRTAVLAMREAFAAGGEAFADTEGQVAQALAVLENGRDA